jgi:hypothetical protein
LESHRKWIYGEKGGERANLSNANLHNANLYNADLRSANLHNANLSNADLSNADLSCADLHSANLSGADLRSADLYSANLSSANLRNADLYNADLSCADLHSAENIEWADAITRIVPDGDIIVWKKAHYIDKDGVTQDGIVKLLVPAKAERSNATSRKCRGQYAVDKGHFTLDGKRTRKDFTSIYDSDFVYKVGETIRPNGWDENRWAECSSGIHFFITRWEAEHYND